MRILKIVNPSHHAVGRYLPDVAYEFPDTPEANAEADRLVNVKGMAEVQAHDLDANTKVVDVDSRWIPALPKPKPEGEG